MLWGSIQPTESLQTRLRLDFGLRPAILAFNEWTVPGLGGAFFVRQLSWGCIGIRLADELGQPLMAAKIAESMEAFASWIALKSGGRDYAKDDRIQGKRKFSDINALSFNAVTQGGAYVTVPFRRAATAALPGLGFCEKVESRFNLLKLSRPGAAMAEAALGQHGARKILKDWISARSKSYERVNDQVKQALLPHAATSEERNLVKEQLLADDRRVVLMRLIETEDEFLSSLGHSQGQTEFLSQVPNEIHRRHLDAAFSFERVRAAVLQAAQELANTIKAESVTFKELAQGALIQSSFAEVARQVEELSVKLAPLSDIPEEIRFFCEEQQQNRLLEDRLRGLAMRVPLIFVVKEKLLEKGIGNTSELVSDDAVDPVEGDAQSTSFAIPKPLLRLKRLSREIMLEAQTDE